jgi:negative regulator of flagellin synthesis FlgM
VADKGQIDTTQPATSQTGDHVTLTTSARSLQKLSDAVAQAPVVNSEKVASIKQALAKGTYQIDSASVANKMIQFENGLK